MVVVVSSKLFNQTLALIRANKKIIDSGKYNCIYTPFPTLRRAIPGIRKGDHTCITAASGVGKSIFTKFYAILSPVLFSMANPDYKIKVIYFALEESKEYIMAHLMCNRLKRECGLELTPDELMSYYENVKIDDNTLKCIESQENFFYQLESRVHIIDDMFDVDHIISYIEAIKQSEVENPTDTHYIFVMDHISLLESSDGTEYKAMGKYSRAFRTDYCKFGFSSIIVQQQAMAGESAENFKLNRAEPSKTNLGDNKLLGRDYDLILGLYSPYEHKIDTYHIGNKAYDIRQYKDSFRVLSVIKNRRGRSKIAVALEIDGQLNFHELI